MQLAQVINSASARCLPPVAFATRTKAVQRGAQQVAFAKRGGLEEEIALEAKIEDTPGVESLLQRDRRGKELKAEELLAAFGEEPAAAASSSDGGKPATATATAEPEVAAAPQQQQKQRGPASKRADKLRSESSTPQRSREAIDAGLLKFQQGDYQAAIDLFQLSLELPGSGVMRLSGSVREYSCPSEGEENAALYNMACAYAALRQPQAALTVLEALLENNFTDYNAIKTDPDLASLRGAELDKLLAKRDGLLAKLFGGKKQQSSSNKPWLQW